MSDFAHLREQLAHRVSTTPLERGFCMAAIATNPEQFSRARACASVFPSTLTLLSLQAAGHPQTLRTQERIAEALWTQQSKDGSWNYWQRTSPDAARQPYPDDLDTTCCALAALAHTAPEHITGDLLAKVTMLLLTAETNTSGPYHTWLVPGDADAAWKDIDPAVNANIGRFLATQAVDLPGLTHYLQDATRNGHTQSPYYPSPTATAYFLSAWWKPEHAAQLLQSLHAHQHKNGSWGTPLETAWALSALIRWEGRSPQAATGIQWLASRPLKSLARPYALCTHAIQGVQKEYLGATHVTLAACLEALTVWDACTPHAQHTSTTKVAPPATHAFEHLATRIATLPHPLRPLAQEQLNRFQKSNEGQDIAELPYRFVQTLPPHLQAKIPDALLALLGAINLYGWIAYTIYDNVLDEEADLQQLPVAQFCLRELTTQYARLARRKGTQELFHRVLDGIDAANGWEILFWRLQETAPGTWRIPYPLPDAEAGRRLAQRSLGHALGPLTLLTMAGHAPTHPHFQALETFFTHYLIARQMDDDAHDWEEDLARGHVNSVSTDLLNAWIPTRPNRLLTTKNLPALRAFFWEQHAEPICTRILQHTTDAEQHLRTIPWITNPTPLLTLLAPIRTSANRALAEREKTLAFLNTYQAPTIKSAAPTPPSSKRQHSP